MMDKIKLFLKTHWMRLAAFALVIVLMVCSMTFVGKKYTDPETYGETIQSIDEKKTTVLGVSAAIAGSATLLAAVPDDSTTPLAEELMDLSGYLMAVVCVLVLEKSLLTVFGAVACYVLFPIACLFALGFIIRSKPALMSWAIKIAVLAFAFLLIIPTAMKISDYIYQVNEISIEEDVDDIIAEPEAETTEAEEEEELPWYKKLWDNVTEAVQSTAQSAVESGKKVLNEFIDAVSAFFIAYCAIPVFVVFMFLWLLKFLFGINININYNIFSMRKIREKVKSNRNNPTA